jgi:hypothetical protein
MEEPENKKKRGAPLKTYEEKAHTRSITLYNKEVEEITNDYESLTKALRFLNSPPIKKLVKEYLKNTSYNEIS